MHKLKYKDCVKFRRDKDKKRDHVSHKSKRRVATDLIVKKALVVWDNSSSASKEFEHLEDASMMAIKYEEDVFDSMFAIIEKSGDEDNNEVTLDDFKLKKLNVYSFRKL